MSSGIDISDSGMQGPTALTCLERMNWWRGSFSMPLMPVYSFCHFIAFSFPSSFIGGWFQNLIPGSFFLKF